MAGEERELEFYIVLLQHVFNITKSAYSGGKWIMSQECGRKVCWFTHNFS